MPLIRRIQPWWTPRYAFDKFVLHRWEKKHPNEPWLTSRAVGLLTTLLTPEDEGLEWGSGRSTVWFGKRVAKLTSVESSVMWHEKVSQQIKELGLQNIEYFLCLGGSGPEADLREYTGVADRFTEGSLDFALVDGAFRSACANLAVPKLRPGGLLIVDDVHRFLPCSSRAPKARSFVDGTRKGIWWEEIEGLAWADFREAVKDWRYIWTSDGVKDTAIWIRPGR